MSQKESKSGEYPTTRMRSPFTAEVPNEYGKAKWVPDLTSLPDRDEEKSPVPDPLAFVPGSKDRSTGD